MGIIRKPEERIRELEAENRALRGRLQKAEDTSLYIAMMTEVDIFDDEEAQNEQNV